MRIQAALVESPGGPFTVHDDLVIAAPRPDEILVRMTAAGICHTDLSARRSWPAERSPMVFGHEGAGVVEAVGEEVDTVRPGDSVALSYRSCTTCGQCSARHPAYCETGIFALNASGARPDGTTPLSRANGDTVFGNFFGQSAFASHAIAHRSNVVKVPADLPPAIAAPLGCGVQTGVGTVLNVLRPPKGSSVAVFGTGSVGLSSVMAAVAEGCDVIAVDPLPARRAKALEFGATAAVDPTTDDVAEAVRDLTGGGPHHAIDTTGQAEVISQAVTALRRQGTLALVGIGGQATFDIMTVMTKGLRIRGVIEGDARPAEFIPHLVALHREGTLPLHDIITEFPFAEIERAAQAASAGQVIKPVLRFG
ncbi:NAD(P)-dependent alcohol dehydrogenase [Streptomyces sp. GS7]|uniref:NAD(P)-dependent alcohol dehydrogenase n=1 Tax=Streptomyces sp. GS7 TaxID=2692234 RepID=UPI001319674C|nr:NAD(P)-dependent alcohol dehydrogenase [Streptomyces sp. GS7]QHC22727.1 zinc-binding dehydrogenase [Streptomyces sp. GS7]